MTPTTMARALLRAVPELAVPLYMACHRKMPFPTRESAERVAQHPQDGFKLYVYRCDFCGKYHLTKKLH